MCALAKSSKSASTGQLLTVVTPRRPASGPPAGTVSTTLSSKVAKSAGKVELIVTVPSEADHQFARKGSVVSGAPTRPSKESCGEKGAGTAKWYTLEPSALGVSDSSSCGTWRASTPAFFSCAASCSWLVSLNT